MQLAEGDIDDQIGEKFKKNNYQLARLYLLQLLDQLALKRIRCSLDPYGAWFIVHWLLYVVTAFFSIAFLVDAFTLHYYNTHKMFTYHNRGLEIAYIALFTIEHLFLFMYPCFRAAKVKATREKLIARVSKYQWKNSHSRLTTNVLSHKPTYACTRVAIHSYTRPLLVVNMFQVIRPHPSW